MTKEQTLNVDLKDKFQNKAEQIAQTYRNRLFTSMVTMDGQICECCESIVSTTISLEDESRNLNICGNCYSHISKLWKNNYFKK